MMNDREGDDDIGHDHGGIPHEVRQEQQHGAEVTQLENPVCGMSVTADTPMERFAMTPSFCFARAAA